MSVKTRQYLKNILKGALALGVGAAVVAGALSGVNTNAMAADAVFDADYEAAVENGVKVFVDAPEGALPEGAELHAELVESEKDNQAVADELEKAEVSYDGFLALDVFFTDVDGNEVEPVEPVDVRFELPEGTLPEGAEDLAVHHLAEAEDGTVSEVEAVADDADATEGTVAVQDDATVDAEFTVKSFSTFTITWNNNWWQSITIHCVDESGNEIGSNPDNVDRESVITMSDIAPDISGYTYDHAKVAHRAGEPGTVFTQLRYGSRDWQYYIANNQSWRNVNNNNVYLVYSKQIGTVETVDSAAQGVHMYMFNYGARQFNEGGYTVNGRTGDVKEGLVSSSTNANGWPVFSGEYETQQGKSLAWLFGNTESAYEVDEDNAVNHLFRKSEYDEDGTFYYSAFENYATLANDSDENFTLYDALGSPAKAMNDTDAYYFKRGNFMPYNDLDTSTVYAYNQYTAEGEELEPNDDGYWDPIYATDGADFHFGMYVWADFYQPKDGKVTSNDGSSSEDMIFEFTGDDDMWVFIDGVLVLDLGGIHDAQSGRINFATGQVDYTDTTIDENHKNQPNKPEWHQTTIKEQYERAGKADNYNWDGSTYADGSSHRIQIFYMERGEGASNLKISFNLKTIPDGQLSVMKDVENYYAPQVADIEYTMQVNVNGEPHANAAYTIVGNEGTVLHTDPSGQFKLKHDQTALFPDLQVGDKVTVKEVSSTDAGPGVTIEDNYEISYTVTDGAGNTTGDKGADGTVTAEMPGYGSIRVTVNNKATYTRPLKVVKNFEGTEGNKAPDGFEATYTLYEVDKDDGRTKIGSVKYSDFENGEYTFWLDTDKNYTVVETFVDGDNKGDTESSKWSSVTTTTNDAAEGTEASDGIVHLDEYDATEGNEVDTITLTNHYGLTIKDVLKVTKTLNGHPLDKGMFDFTVEPKAWDNGKEGDEKVEVTAQQAASKADLTLDGATYTYENEGTAQSGVAGLVRMGNEITFTTDDIGKTYVYEYAELGGLNEAYLESHQGLDDVTNDDILFDSARYKVELAVSDEDGKLQVTMSKFMWDAEDGAWKQADDAVTITSANCDCSDENPLMTVDFKNTYVQGTNISFPVGIEKTLEGDSLIDDMFQFTVTAKTTDTVDETEAAFKAGFYTQEGDTIKPVIPWEVTNTGDKFSVIGAMHFTAGDADNVYEYVIAEDDSYIGPGYERDDFLYDDTQYLVQFKPVIATSAEGAKSLEVELWVAERDGAQGNFSKLEKVGVYSHGEFNRVDSQAEGRALQDDPQYLLEFTNKVSKADLRITKKLEQGVTPGVPNSAQFKIQIELIDQDGELVNGTFDAAVGSETRKVEFKDGVATVTIKADETIVIKGVPVGAACKVSEPEDQIPGGFELAWVDGSPVADGKADTRAANKDEWNGEIDPDGSDVTVTNRFVGYGVQIFKGELAESEDGGFVASHDKPLEGAEFELYALNPETGEELVMGRLTTDSDGSAVFQDVYSVEQGKLQLPAGTYFIRETKVPAGYQLLEKEIKLEIKADGSADFTIINDKGEPVASKKGVKPNESGNFTYDVANKPNPGLPSSGSNGTLLMMSTGFAAIVLAGTYLSKRFGHLWN